MHTSRECQAAGITYPTFCKGRAVIEASTSMLVERARDGVAMSERYPLYVSGALGNQIGYLAQYYEK